MKRTLRIFALSIALLMALGALSASQSARMQRAQRCFSQNRDALTDLAHRFDAGERSGLSAEGIRGAQRLVITVNPARMEVHTEAFGIAPSSVYSGLLYSPEQAPLPVEKGVGDNRVITRRICGDWYYFEASY